MEKILKDGYIFIVSKIILLSFLMAVATTLGAYLFDLLAGI